MSLQWWIQGSERGFTGPFLCYYVNCVELRIYHERVWCMVSLSMLGLGGSLTSSLQCVVKRNDHEIIYLRSHPTHSNSLWGSLLSCKQNYSGARKLCKFEDNSMQPLWVHSMHSPLLDFKSLWTSWFSCRYLIPGRRTAQMLDVSMPNAKYSRCTFSYLLCPKQALVNVKTLFFLVETIEEGSFLGKFWKHESLIVSHEENCHAHSRQTCDHGKSWCQNCSIELDDVWMV